MKKFSAKMLCGVMAWSLAISPIFACTAAPKADVSKPVPNQNSSTYCECMIASAEKAPEQKSKETEEAGTRAKCGSNKPISKPETCKPSAPVKPETCKPSAPVKPETCKPAAPVKPTHNKPATDNESTQNTFVIDNFKVIQGALQKLGVQPEELEGMIKEGKKLPEVLELKNIPVAKFKKALLKQYYAAINEGVKNKQITKEEAKMLRAAIKEKVMSWLQTK
ncbi:MAG: hypothetical protein ACLSH8_00900 [Zhenhengia sp.]|jgi:hypothetical protein|uniref:hypothetical protein n=1 Tax=Zhenhengia sp. TaxID=2944208 RepID=UPI00290CD2B4|nr:hypothetical protein [Clostridiales bacterium]MDU6973219.1 hypothetical protein [Clostridiales bacterium]